MSAGKRSAVMSRTRGKDTRAEVQVGKLLLHQGFCYKPHGPRPPSRPDFVMPRWRAVCLLHGCFCRYHEGCPLFSPARDRFRFLDRNAQWKPRTRSNVGSRARRAGWRVAAVWDCAHRLDQTRVGNSITHWLRSDSSTLEVFRSAGQVVDRDGTGPECGEGQFGHHETATVRLAKEE